MQKRKGFTLVELLVVIAIIALLSTLAVVSLSNIREKGRDTKRLSDMDALKTAFELVNNEMGGYDDAMCNNVPNVVSTCTGLSDFLPSIVNMKDPSNSAGLCNSASSDTCNYTVSAVSPDSYTIYFYLEAGAGSYNAGPYMLTEQGIAPASDEMGWCGDGACNNGETEMTCPGDCGAINP